MKTASTMSSHREVQLLPALPSIPSRHSLRALVIPWVISFAPSVVVLLAGMTVFREMVLKSIETASHPSLVYGILLAFLMGVVLSALALYKFQSEKIFIKNWMALKSNEARRSSIDSSPYEDTRKLAYPALAAVVLEMSSSERQVKFEHEMRSVETGLTDKLVFPNFIAGALVGLGLVGTFVGLLGTLEDLGAVFGSLAKTGDSGANPTAVFADMVLKLQDPMRGMGTAFVTSLYGLLGSLVVGLSSLSVSKAGNTVIKDLYAAERLYSSLIATRFSVNSIELSPDSNPVGQLKDVVLNVLQAQAARDASLQEWAEGSEKRLSKLLDQMLEVNWSVSTELVANSKKAISHFVEVTSQQNENVQLVFKQLSQQQISLKETVSLLSKQVNNERALVQHDMLAMIERNQRENKGELERLERIVGDVALMTGRSVNTIERYMQQQETLMGALPKTYYWKEAWAKVQSYLRKSKQEADLALLAQAVERQTLVLQRLTLQMMPAAMVERMDAETGHNDTKT
jgi:hypothetical protein